MFCKHCGKEIADNSAFCQYCGGKQDVIDTTSNSEEIKLGGFYEKEDPQEVVAANEEPEPPNSSIPSQNAEPNVLDDIDDSKEYTLEELNNYINKGVEKIGSSAI